MGLHDDAYRLVARQRRLRDDRQRWATWLDGELTDERRGECYAAILAELDPYRAVGMELVALRAMPIPPDAPLVLTMLTAEPAKRLIELAHDWDPGALPGRQGVTWYVWADPVLLHLEAPQRRHAFLAADWDRWLTREQLLACGLAVAVTDDPQCRGAARRRRRALRQLVVRDQEPRC